MALKAADLVDVEWIPGSWCNGTVVEISDKERGRKSVKVALKVYNKNGNK
jgi:hypothetical protein